MRPYYWGRRGRLRPAGGIAGREAPLFLGLPGCVGGLAILESPLLGSKLGSKRQHQEPARSDQDL